MNHHDGILFTITRLGTKELLSIYESVLVIVAIIAEIPQLNLLFHQVKKTPDAPYDISVITNLSYTDGIYKYMW